MTNSFSLLLPASIVFLEPLKRGNTMLDIAMALRLKGIASNEHIAEVKGQEQEIVDQAFNCEVLSLAKRTKWVRISIDAGRL